MNNLQLKAQQILGLIDLTSLNDNDATATIKNLCTKATTAFGSVPAICIYSRFIPIAKTELESRNIKIATVTNFPHGSNDLELALLETKLAITRGADEVDIVFPYHALIRGDVEIGESMIREAKKICGDKILKVIIESGELKTEELIKLASKISITNGADFIKTSTGKVSGGIQNVVEALKYLDLAEKIMGSQWINATNFRFGASGLLGDVITILNNKTEIENA
jgi:deoxyribose-phosphate aldolase